ncbi:hypothetical protein FOFC_04558, partial [Fusarium oxysporum]
SPRHPDSSVRGARQRKDQRLLKRFESEILEETLKVYQCQARDDRGCVDGRREGLRGTQGGIGCLWRGVCSELKTDREQTSEGGQGYGRQFAKGPPLSKQLTNATDVEGLR